MAYEVVMSYHLHMPSYFLGTFTEYPYVSIISILEIIRQLQRPSFLWTDACSCCNAI